MWLLNYNELGLGTLQGDKVCRLQSFGKATNQGYGVFLG